MENKKPHHTSCLLLIAKLTVSLGNTLNLILLLDGIAAQQHKLSRPFMLTINVIETIPGVPNATSAKACTAAPVRYSSIYNFAAVQFCTLPALLLRNSRASYLSHIVQACAPNMQKLQMLNMDTCVWDRQ